MRENERGDFFALSRVDVVGFSWYFPSTSPRLTSPIYWIVVTHALCYLNSGTRVFPHTKKRHKFALKMVIRLTRRLVCPSVHTCTRKTQKSMLGTTHGKKEDSFPHTYSTEKQKKSMLIKKRREKKIFFLR